MKKTVTINIASLAFYIDEDAYEELKKYQQKPIRTVAASAPAAKEQAPALKGIKVPKKIQAEKPKQFEFNPEPKKSDLI